MQDEELKKLKDRVDKLERNLKEVLGRFHNDLTEVEETSEINVQDIEELQGLIGMLDEDNIANQKVTFKPELADTGVEMYQ